jgi:phosphoglycolate phosphatase-like HAD superfamily hydrolase
MKTVLEYITEAIQRLPREERGIIVFDIDDTLIKANSKMIKVIKHPNGDKSQKIYLSSEEYAQDPDVPAHKDWFDFSEFNNPIKVMQSIVHGTPILNNLKILDAYIKAGYEFCFLTARGCEDVVKYAIQTTIKHRDADGILKDITPHFNKKFSAAVNDSVKAYKGSNDPEKKANVLRNLCREFDKVVFVDDDHKNVASAKSLKLNNLKVIQAWKE